MISRRSVLASGLVLAAARPLPGAAQTAGTEPPLLAAKVAKGQLPPMRERLPEVPVVVDMAGRGREIGRHGGDIRTIVSKVRDLRYITVYGYTRLVVYDEKLNLVPDILEQVDAKEDRIFTFTLRVGHRWSDGYPFTSEDFRYYWEDICNNSELSPYGPPDVLLVDGKKPHFEVIDERRVRFSWHAPNPRFIPHLAQPRPNFIYAPAHYLRKYHIRYSDPKELAAQAKQAKLRSWAALHNRLDDPYENANPEMPTLSPWVVVTKRPASRFIFERNPFYHRADSRGQQLPYADRIVVDIAAPGLFAAKANAGEVDLLARGLAMADVPVLREGEKINGYRTLLWPTAKGSAYALYPNLTVTDPVWRALNRDVRYRRALSLSIDRRMLNNALLFGLGTEGNNTVTAQCRLYKDTYRTLWAAYDPVKANALLDEIGLIRRDSHGFRLLSDGRRAEVIVEMDGEAGDLTDALTLIGEFWRDVGIKLFPKAQDRTNLRKRAYAGLTVMVAAQGMDTALVTSHMPPAELAPVSQTNYAWPRWGQYYESSGKLGEPVDMPGAKRLMELYASWLKSVDMREKDAIWHEMLALHADQQWVIGTVAGDIQPIVASNRLRNVPREGLFSWEPGALLGVYRPDEFYLSDKTV
jgi:peptide/nickel transport system substrate-binding protein